MWNRKRKLARERLESRLNRALVQATIPPTGGWIRALRSALGMTAAQLGRRMGVGRQTVDGLERSERAGTIRLTSLRRAAEALDCDVVYALVPRTPLRAQVEQRARGLALAVLERANHSMALEDQAVDDLEAEIERYIDEHISERDLW